MPISFDPFQVAAAQGDPYRVYAMLREAAPVYHNASGGFWTLSRFEEVRSASRDWASLSNADGVDLDELGARVFGPGDFLDMDPPEHDELRAVVRTRFTPKSVADLAPLVDSELRVLLEKIGDRDVFDGVGDLAWPLPTNVMCALLGFTPNDRATISGLYREVMARRPGETAIPPQALRAAAELSDQLLALATERRRRPAADLMSQIALGEVDGKRLSDRKVVGMAFVLFSAGVDTVAGLIANCLFLLATHPDQRKLLTDERAIVPAAIEEILRYESPLQFNARTTTRPVEVNGSRIPAGERVLLLYGSANRDERRFVAADRFDVTRVPKRHLAFGEGIHFCIGAPLARLQARLTLTRMLSWAPHWAVAGPVVRLSAYNMRSLAQLPLAAGG
jgi:cytochrome P450